LGSIITNGNNCERDIKARMAAENELLCSDQNNEVMGDIKKHQTENIQNNNQANSRMVVRDGLCPNIWRRLSEYGKERS
jgi:hypothetical protein